MQIQIIIKVALFAFAILAIVALVIFLRGIARNELFVAEERIMKGVDPVLPIRFYRVADDLVTEGRPSLELPQTFMEVSIEKGVMNAILKPARTFQEAQFVLFESFNNVDSNLMILNFPNSVKWIYGIRGTDEMANKSLLAKYFKDGKLDHRYLPTTYRLDQDADVIALQKEFDRRNVYIMKKNVQRQQGVFLTQSLSEILMRKDEYTVVQVVLNDPLLVGKEIKRKINIRVYLLIVINERGESSWHIYENGFMYYTPRAFKEGSVEVDENVTTGYIDRSVYAVNPLTILDLQDYLGSKRFNILFTNIRNMMTDIKMVYAPVLEKASASLPGTKFLIYGVDVAPAADLTVKIMEINKGPDLGYKDERDKAVKYNMVKSALYKVGIYHPDDPKKAVSGFIDV